MARNSFLRFSLQNWIQYSDPNLNCSIIWRPLRILTKSSILIFKNWNELQVLQNQIGFLNGEFWNCLVLEHCIICCVYLRKCTSCHVLALNHFSGLRAMTIFAWNWDDADDSHYNGFTEVYIIYQKEKGREETLAERKLFPPLKTVHKSDVGCFNV